jgi:anti-sigma B factor antagonist
MMFAEQPLDGPLEPPLRLAVPTPFRVTREVVGSSVTLVLEGELDLSTTPILEQALAEEARNGRHVVVDLDALDFIDSSGIVVLVQATKAARANRHALTMTRGSAPVRRVIDACMLGDFLPFTD